MGFLSTSLHFLGYLKGAIGIHKTEELTKAMMGTPRPKTSLNTDPFWDWQFCMANLYQTYLLYPMYRLLDNNTKWVCVKNVKIPSGNVRIFF